MSCYSKTQDNFIICADVLKSVVKGYLKLFKLHSVGFLRIFFVFGFCSKGHMYFNLFSDINEVCIKTQINPRFCKLLKTRKNRDGIFSSGRWFIHFTGGTNMFPRQIKDIKLYLKI